MCDSIALLEELFDVVDVADLSFFVADAIGFQ
jgi:hypothetical protein